MPEQSINEQTRQMMGMPTSGDPAIIDPTTGRPYTADASIRQQEEITRQAEVKEEFASEQRLQLPKDLEEEIEEEIRPKARPEGLPNIYEKKTAIDKTLEYGYLLKERQPGAKGKTKIVTGLDERNPAHQKIIKAFFDSAVGGDTGFDPTKQAWCAAFVNHILTEMGADLIESKDPYKRLRANEYKTYGKPVDLENIQEGDIVVFDFDKDGTADHVTFYAGGRITSQGEGQYINVIGGNQGGGEVSIRENEPGYTLDNVAAIRRVTYDGDAYEIAQSHKDSDPVFKTFLPEEHEDYALNLQGNYNEGGDVAAQMNSMLPKKGMSYGELILDNILGLDNEYESFGEKLGKAINEDEVGFLKDASVGAYEGAKELITSPIQTTKKVFSEIKDGVQRLGSENLNTRLNNMYGVSYADATDDQVNSAKEAVFGDAITALSLVPAAKATVSVAKAGIKNANIDKVMTLGETEGSTFKGKLNLVHGFNPPTDAPNLVPTFTASEKYGGERYGELDGAETPGGSYGATGVYLENPSDPLFFNSPEMQGFYAPKTAQVSAQFNKAFILRPDTLKELEQITGINLKDSLPKIEDGNLKEKNYLAEEQGALVSAKLKELGYDGLIVKDFFLGDKEIDVYDKYEPLRKKIEVKYKEKFGKPIPEKGTKEHQQIINLYNKQNKELEKIYSQAGIHPLLTQPQIIHLKPETLNTEKVFPESLQSNPSQVSDLQGTQPIQGEKTPGYLERALNKLPEYDPNTLGSMGGNINLTSKAANSPDEPKIISFTKKKEDKELENFNANLMSSISEQASKQAELVGELQEAGVYGDYQKGVRVQGQNYKGEALPPYTITGLSLNKVKLNSPNLKRTEDRLGIKFEYIEKDGDYYLPMLSVEQADGGKSQVYLDALKQRNTPIMGGPEDTVKKEMISVFPKPERMFPEESRPKGGDYLNPATGEVLSGRNVSSAKLSISPEGKPSFKVSNDNVETVGSTGKGKTQIKTNLFKKKAGWKWTKVPEGMENIGTLISVQNKGKHFYTVETDFSKGVNLKKYPDSKTEPRLRPTVVGELEIGPQIGTISVRGKEHPVYQNIKTFNKGGAVMNEQMEMAFMNQGGLKDDGMKRDPVSGNEIPNGSMAKEVRDDISAQLSEGEYVVPADVVRYLGVKHFEDLRDKAKQGLQSMEANGRIGGEPVPVGGPQAAPMMQQPQQMQPPMPQAPTPYSPQPAPPQMAMGGDLSPEEMNEINSIMMAQGGMVPADPYQQQQMQYAQPNMVMGAAEGTDVTSDSFINPGGGITPGQAITMPTNYSFGFSNEPPGPSLVPRSVTLYGPNGEQEQLVLPAQQARYDELIGQGYTTTNPTDVEGSTGSTPSEFSDDSDDPIMPPATPGAPGTSFTGFKNWGSEVDWADPESVEKFVNQQYNMPDPTLRKGAGMAGLFGAGPLAAVGTIGSLFMAGQVLDTVADLRSSVMIAKAYGNTEGAAMAQAKLDLALKGAPSYVTSMVGDTLAGGTMQFAGHVSGASGLDDLPSDIDAWTENDFTRFQNATGKKAPVEPAAGKTKKTATPSSYDTTTKKQIQQKQKDRSERSSQITAGQKIASQDMSGKSLGYKTEAVKQATKGTTKKQREGGAELDASMGISGLNKGGLMEKKPKKK